MNNIAAATNNLPANKITSPKYILPVTTFGVEIEKLKALRDIAIFLKSIAGDLDEIRAKL